MAGNLGSLIVHLGADTASLQSDLGRANAIFQRDMAKMEKAAVQFGKVAGVAIAAAGTAIAGMLKSSINNADELSKLSSKVGISTEALSALKHQAGLAGVELAGLQTGLVKFSRTAAEAAGGGKQQARVFEAMGISVRDLQGSLKPADALLREVADKFQTYGDGAGKAALAVQLFGRAGADMIPMLNEGAEGFEAARKEAEEFGIIVDSKAAKAAEQFNDNLDRLKTAAMGAANQIMEELLPALVQISDAMVQSSKSSDELALSAFDLGKDMFDLSEFIAATVREVQILTNVVAAGVDVFQGFGDVTTGVLTNLGYSIRSAMKAASGDMQGAAQDMELAGRALGDGWESGSQRIGIAIESAKTGIADAKGEIIDFGNVVGDANYSTGQFANVIGGFGEKIVETEAPLVNFGGAIKKVADESAKFVQSALDRAAALQQEAETFGQSEGAILLYEAANLRLSEAERLAVESAAASIDARNAQIESLENIKRAHEELGDNVLQQITIDAAYDKSLLKMTGRQRAFAEAQKQAGEYFKANKALFAAVGVSAEQYANAMGEAAVATFDANEQAADLERILSQFGDLDFGNSLTDQIKKVGEALEEATDPEQVERLGRALEQLRKKQINANTSAFLDLGDAVISSMKGAAEEGSRTMAALELASAGIAMTQGILAILTQGQGDPYTAFARMAAMAALVIPLAAQAGAAISMAGGAGFSDTAAQRQASQGTGTVLGDATAKSESIANAVEITADATTQLVGLNRGMLNALLALQDGLSGAAGLLARGAGEADFSGMNLAVGGAGSGLFDGKGLLGRLLTGSSKITDEGIVIMGGALMEMLENISVGAYQEVQSRSWAFGSTHTNTGVVDVTDEFGRQFELVMQSIADTVREGAEALGLLPADIQAAMEAFRVEEIRISLKGLTAEEQQAELEAVFSAIFDGLAGAVVPFIEQFQQVGEGLGETLVRIATEVQVAQEAFRQLGLVVNVVDPERFAQISDSLIQAAGGLEAFITGMQTFVAAFSTEAYQFDVASSELSSAFAQVGLAVPDTREGMWELMQSLDATTEAGQEQIATLLRLAGVADEYYSLLDQQIESFDNVGGDVVKFREAISQIHAQMQASIARANELARANGKEGASTEELSRIHSRAADLFARVLAQLRNAAQELAFSMGLTNIGSAGQIDAEIARLEGMAGSSSTTIREFGDAMMDAANRANEAINLLLGDLSPLNDREKLQTALEGLRAGTVSQEQVLEIGRRLYASSQAYNDLFAMVQGYGRPAPGSAGGSSGVGGSQAGGLSQADRDRLEALYLQRDAAMAQQDYLNAQTLAGQIAEIAEASGEDYMAVLDDMGINAEELAERLHLDNVQQLDEWIERFQQQTDSQEQQSTILADLLREILAAIRGDTVGADVGRDRGGSDQDPRRRRSMTDADVDAISRGVENGTRRAIEGTGPRNSRTDGAYARR
jgi:hypothetical protein